MEEFIVIVSSPSPASTVQEVLSIIVSFPLPPLNTPPPFSTVSVSSPPSPYPFKE